jgi:hypothetical protein
VTDRALITPSGPKLTRLQVTGLLVAGGAIVGALVGILILGLEILLHGDNPFTRGAYYEFAAAIGGAFGGIAAPLGGWGLFRATPLGKATLLTGAGALIGALLGEWVAPINPKTLVPGFVVGAICGFLLAAVLARWLSGRRLIASRHVS